MFIGIVTSVDDELFTALQQLVPQLTSTNPPPAREDLAALIQAPESILVVARLPDEAGAIVGAASLAVYHVPTGLRAVIEDVIVEKSARGRGVGEALVRRLLEIARTRGAPGAGLTSNPGRVAANRLYQRMGFVRRETNAYYFKFG